MIKQTKILTLLMLFSITSSRAQNVHGNVGLEDGNKPNASKGSMGQNIVNVSPYTGVGSVNIPIYEYSIDGVDANVSLGYICRGVRVDELASSIGLGWNLAAGGQIVRQVNGLEDEVTLSAQFVNNSSTTPDYLQGNFVPGANLDKNTQNVDDMEADLFSVDLGGRSFEFTLARNGSGDLITRSNKTGNFWVQPLLYDYNPSTGTRQATSNFASGPDSITGVLAFVIHDLQGNRFFFDRGNYQYKQWEFPSNKFTNPYGTYYPVNTWNLTKVVTHTGKEIVFGYRRKYVEYEESRTETYYVRERVLRMIDPLGSTTDPNNYVYDHEPMEIKTNMWKGIKTHIESISYPSGVTVAFDLDQTSNLRCDCPGDYKVSRISISGGIAPDNRRIDYWMQHKYFRTPAFGLTSIEENDPVSCPTLVSDLTSTNVGSQNLTEARNDYQKRGHRLKLIGIRRYVSLGNTANDLYEEQYYTFSYNTTPLPYRFSPQKDYYGYYNGKTNTPYQRYDKLGNLETFATSIPYHTDANASYWGTEQISRTWGQDKTYDFGNAQAFVLNKVKNANGGEILINYTNYTLSNPQYAYLTKSLSIPGGQVFYSWTVDPNLEGGTANDGLVVGSLEYKNLYDGIYTTKTSYSYLNGQRFHQGGFTWYLNDTGRVLSNIFLSNIEYLDGSNHGFSNVTVTNTGHNNEWLSASRYTFTNLVFDDAFGNHHTNLITHTNGDYRHMLPALLRKYRMGLPLLVEELDETLQVKNETENLYFEANLGDSTSNTKFYNSSYIDDTYGRPTGTMAEYTYNILNNRVSQLAVKKERKNVGTAQMNSNSYYDYDLVNRLTKLRWNDSKGTQFIKHIKFNTQALTYSTVNYKFYEEIWKQVGTDTFLVGFNLQTPTQQNGSLGKFNKFSLRTTSPLSGLVAGSSIYIDRSGAFNPNATSFGINLGKDYQAKKYDSKGYAVEEVTHNGNELSAGIYDWRTDNILAIVKNANYDDIAFTSFEGGQLYDVNDPAMGNWNFDPNAVEYVDTTITGKFAYKLTYDETIKSKPLTNKRYLLSFWYNANLVDNYGTTSTQTTNPPKVYLMTASNSIRTSYNCSQFGVSCNVKNKVGNWWLYTVEIDAQNGDYIEILNPTSSAPTNGYFMSYIDEVRLHPTSTTMTSFSYHPLYGKTSTTDANNYIRYYEYDPFGRYNLTRDLRKNIVEKIELKYQDPDVPQNKNDDDENDPDNG